MSFVERIFGGHKNEVVKPQQENKDKNVENVENKEVAEQQKQLLENTEKLNQLMESVGGAEGLQEAMNELGEEKIDSIANRENVKGALKKLKGALKKLKEMGIISGISSICATLGYVLTSLNNMSYDKEAIHVDPRIGMAVALVGSALIAYSILKGFKKEKMEKEARQSNPVMA